MPMSNSSRVVLLLLLSLQDIAQDSSAESHLERLNPSLSSISLMGFKIKTGQISGKVNL